MSIFLHTNINLPSHACIVCRCHRKPILLPLERASSSHCPGKPADRVGPLDRRPSTTPISRKSSRPQKVIRITNSLARMAFTSRKVAVGLLLLFLGILLRLKGAQDWPWTLHEDEQDRGTLDIAAYGGFAPTMAILKYAVGALLASGVTGQLGGGIGNTINLPSYPLAVKSPYLSTWLPGYAANNSARAQPEFWTGQNLTWPVLARVDGKTYALFGDPNGSIAEAATTDAVRFTSTRTYFLLSAGSTKFLLDFFTPVFPGKNEYARQSLPYSYLTVTAASASLSEPSVQVLSGIDQTWTAQDGRANVNFTASATAGLFQYFNPDAQPYTERGDMATYGSVVFAASNGENISQTCASQDAVFDSFSQDGVLTKSDGCDGSDLVAISQDLGKLGAGNRSPKATFVVGFQRDLAINYLGKAQTGYHRSKWPTIPEAVEYVLDSYDSAVQHAESFDQLIRSKSEAVSSEYGSQYADIVEASIRQTFATMDITVSTAHRLSFWHLANSSKVPIDDLNAAPSVYLKEISSDGNLNTVDLIFQTWPVFISLNPDYIRLLFEPIMQYLDAGRWPHPWVIHDMGTRTLLLLLYLPFNHHADQHHLDYPNATGHDNGRAEQMPLFETSSLFILLLAYEKLTGDTAYARQYTPLLKGYAEWLANGNSLYPSSQLISVDSIPGKANQTGLAIQSAIGLKAASELLRDSKYEALAAAHVNELYYNALGLDGDTLESSTHFTYYHHQNETWNVLFPAFSDVVLNLSTFPAEAWALQSKWYEQAISSLGLSWSDSTKWGLLDWNIVAAAVSSEEVARQVVQTSHAFLTNGKHSVPFGTRYFVRGPREGEWLSNKARPTVGNHLAIMAVKQGLIYEG